MGSILLKNIVVDNVSSDILIEGEIIKSIVPAAESELTDAEEVVDCRGRVAMPGFVNMHTHAGMSMMRGIGEDIVFHEWLDHIWEVEKDLNEEYVYHSTKLACLEMIKTGTTCFNDQYWYCGAAHRAASEMGVRHILSYVVCDRNDPAESERQKLQCTRWYEKAKEEGWASYYAIAIHAIYSVREEMILWAADFARKNKLMIHTHISETEKEVLDCRAQHRGLSPVEYLDSLGVLGPDVIAAHTLWLSENDIRILGERGVNCVHNINSNLKLSSGYKFRYNELRDAGANICLGTDGCASSNNQDMLEGMKTAAIVQKAWRKDPTAMPLPELLRMAGSNAGKALGLNIGVIREGALADIIIVDTDNHHFISPAPFEANFVYSAHSDCVESVICNGRFVMRERIVPNEKQILAQAREALSKF